MQAEDNYYYELSKNCYNMLLFTYKRKVTQKVTYTCTSLINL